MNTTDDKGRYRRTFSIAASVGAILLAGCASAPPIPAGSAEARSKLTQLQANPDLAPRAPAAIKEADLAVRAAEAPVLAHAPCPFNSSTMVCTRG